MKTKLFFAGLVIMAFTASATAQTTGTDQKTKTSSPAVVAWVDANNNGVCDNFENGTSNIQTGRRNYYNRSQRQGAGNGIAYGQGRRAGMRNGFGPGRGRGFAGAGQGRGMGRFYVDDNNNGVCDYYETPANK